MARQDANFFPLEEASVVRTTTGLACATAQIRAAFVCFGMKPLGTFCIFHGQLRFALPRASTLRLRAICNLIDVMFLWPSKAIATTFFKAIFLLLFQVRRPKGFDPQNE